MAEQPPLVTFAQAEQLGGELHDYVQRHAAEAPFVRDDMAWADMVQFVIRRARGLAGEQADG